MIRISLLAAIAAFAWISNVHALSSLEYTVPVTVQARSSPPALLFSWPPNSNAREYVISRKLPHEQTWQQLATLPGNASSFTDSTITAGQVYEYEILKKTTHFPYPSGDASDWVNGHAYVAASLNSSVPDYLGKVILLVDNTIASPLASELNTFIHDLTGDGWHVIRRDVPRTGSPPSIRDLVRAEYDADPAGVRSVILFGHIPVPYSGAINPDMHPGHLGAWPADLYYAEMNGAWTDHTVSVTSAWNAANHNLPGDGKFDQSTIPSSVELEIGRIDFYDLPVFQPRSEVDLLRAYLRKNHEFRHRQFTLPRRGLIRDNFGDISGDAPSVDAWRHYPVFFGPAEIREVGPNSFFSTLGSEGFLWAYAGGGGDYKSIDAVGSSADFANRSPRSAFLILHGSYFGDWNNTDNILRAAIGSQDYTLASIWSGLPHWFMHHLALGQTLGYSTRLTQNNFTLYKSNRNFSPGEVHVALMGDPTLRMFPVIPPAQLSAQVDSSINLSWNASPDTSIVGYHVYHSSASNGPYQRLTPSPLAGTSFSHAAPQGTHHYMVRAIKLETTGSGTFYNPSQAIFIEVQKDSGSQPPTVTLTKTDGLTREVDQDPAYFRLQRSPVSSSPLSIQLNFGGTGTIDVDYRVVGNPQIPGGVDTVDIALIANPDTLLEGNETIEVSLAPSPLYNIGAAASASFTIADDQPNERPTISAIPDLTTPQNTATPPVPFTISDKETPPEDLAVSASSADRSLIPDANITLAGAGANRTISVTPVQDRTGTAKITLMVSDGLLEATRTFLVTVTNANLPPIATDLEITTPEDTPVSVALSGTDPEGAQLSWSILDPPNHGLLSGTPPGLTYTPEPDFYGNDLFTFEVSDGAETSSATVRIAITSVNDLPIPQDDSLELLEDTPLPITLAAFDPEQAPLQFAILSGPAHGTLTGAPPNLVYSPATNFVGNDEFQFIVNDGLDDSAPATISFDVLPVNDFPQALPITLTLLEDQSLAITLDGSDPDQDQLSFTVLTAPSSGLLTGTPPNLVYFPATNFSGSDAFSFEVSDGTTNSQADVEITVSPVDDPPVLALQQEVHIPKNSPTVLIPIPFSDIDTPLDLLSFSAESLSPELINTTNLVIIGSGTNRSLHATPKTNVIGVARIEVSLADLTTSVEAILTLSITNSLPVPRDDTFERHHATTIIPTDALLANDSDPDGDPISILAVTSPSQQGGSVTLVSGSVIYVPSLGLTGNDQFTYFIKDISGDTAAAIVTLTPPGVPRFTSIEQTEAGVLLRFSGSPGTAFRLLASSNTLDWIELDEVNTDVSGQGEYEDADPGIPCRIYRIERK